jgi:hypothetical protein
MTPESPSPPSNEPPPSDSGLIKIFNWEETGTSINSDTLVIRYMKLSTFLLLLDGRLFVPTIQLLQDGDRLESRVPEKLLGPTTYGRKMQPIVEAHEQLLLRTGRGPKVLRPEGSEHSGTTISFLAERWLHELALRRCVWCWNQSTDLLHALWKLYGERGVAVMSTVGRIRKALEKAGAREGIVAPVRYAPLAHAPATRGDVHIPRHGATTTSPSPVSVQGCWLPDRRGSAFCALYQSDCDQ